MRIIIYLLFVLMIPVCCSSTDRINVPFEINKPELNINNLNDLPKDLYIDISEKTNAYIIVHPSYYIFMDEKPFFIKPERKRSIVVSFLENHNLDKSSFIRLMKVYERNEMNFITSATRDKKLVILVLPGSYYTSNKYVYKDPLIEDPYAAYLNEVTRNTASIFYLETVSATSGQISEQDASVLITFLRTIGTTNVYIGGGYVGRCQEEFYKILARIWPRENLALIPEISAFSPDDIKESTSQLFLTSNMNINERAIDYAIRNKLLNMLETRPNIKSLSDIHDLENKTVNTRGGRDIHQ
jgi:hypothetical protein